MKKVVLGITGGIAAYKCVELIHLLREKEIAVRVVATPSALKIVPQSDLEKATGEKIYVDLFSKDFSSTAVLQKRTVEHISLTDWADLFMIAPATANVIAKLAQGIADDFLTTTLLAVHSPILIFPSMNVHMWRNPVVQENIFQLKKRGMIVFDPDSGPLACGYDAEGRLPDPKIIVEETLRLLGKKETFKKKIIVTAGGTQEKIDDIRFITNKSSGKMGIAIAEECFLQGAQVLLVRSTHAVRPRYLIAEKTFTTSEELLHILKEKIPQTDICFHAAAVADFAVKSQISGKLDSQIVHTIELVPQPKIIDQLKKINPQLKLIAFKAEWGGTETELIAKARERLKSSLADAIVANDVSKPNQGFGVDTNEVFVIFANGSFKKIPIQSKQKVAQQILLALQL